MNLEKKIDKDLIEALKAKAELKVSTLRFLKSGLKNLAIEKKLKELKDSDVIQIIRKQTKQREEAIKAYQEGDRPDLVNKESEELKILKAYLPKELSDNELKEIIVSAIEEVQAKSPKEMGKVMKAVLPKVADRAEGKRVSALVLTELAKLGSSQDKKEEEG